MELINKAHPVIAPGAERTKARMDSFIRVSGKEVYFSAVCCKEYDLKLGGCVEFIRIEDKWFFVKSLNKKLGFRLVAKTKYSLRIVNGALSKMIMGSFMFLNFNLEKTLDDYGEFPVIEMIKT